MIDALWLPLATALLGGACLGGWGTRVWYERRIAGLARERTTALVRDWYLRTRAIRRYVRQHPEDPHVRLLRVAMGTDPMLPPDARY